jgi:hypothetical protein
MTPQEIINKSYLGLMRQGQESWGSGTCLYRGPNGTACGIGLLIEDDEFARRLDNPDELGYGTEIASWINAKPELFPDWMIENVNLLVSIQHIHDTSHLKGDVFCEHITDKFRKLAHDMNLTLHEYIAEEVVA